MVRNTDTPFISLTHLNGNVMCAIDTATTGLQAGFHDLIRICIMPLDSEFKPVPSHPPLELDLIPKRKQNIDLKHPYISKMKIFEICQRGLDPDKTADFFGEWFDRLALPIGKKIVPLAYNWPHDRGFIIDWLGWAEFERVFHGHYRDAMCAANYANDRSAFCAERPPYPKLGLSEICKALGIERDRSHEPIQDCMSTAQAYRRMMKQLF